MPAPWQDILDLAYYSGWRKNEILGLTWDEIDEAGDLRQHPPAEFLASHRESTALGVGQAKWTWATLLPEDPMLLPKIIDHVFLVAVHPASGREYEEAQSVGHSLRLLGEPPLAPTLFRRFANLGRFVAPYGVAFTDDSPLTTVPAFGGLIGVRVPPRISSIQLRYRPVMVMRATGLAWSTLVAGFAALVVLRRTGRRSAPGRRGTTIVNVGWLLWDPSQ